MNDATPNNLALSQQVGQLRPADTTAAAVFTAPSSVTGVRYAITRLQVCNTSGAAATYRVFHDDDGTTYDQTTALAYDVPIGAGETIVAFEAQSPSSGLGIKPGGTIGVRTSVNSALTFTAYGTVGRSR